MSRTLDSRPGTRLRALAARVCSERTMERLIDPVIGDLQAEHAAANGMRRRWLALLDGYIAFAKVSVWCGLLGLTEARRNWNPDDRSNLTRVLWRSVLATVAFACLLEMPELMRLPSLAEFNPDARRPLLIAYLAPSALAASVPVGILIGTTLGLAGRTRSRRLLAAILLVAAATSAVSLLNLGWITPAANQAFREEIIGGGVPRGDRELSLLEMREQLGQWDTRFPETGRRDRDRRVLFEYHRRYAFALAPLTLVLFALLLAPRRPLGKAGATFVVFAAVAGSFFIWRLGAFLNYLEAGPPPLGAWLLHLLVATAATALIIGRYCTTLIRRRA